MAILQSDLDDAVDRLTVGPRRLGIELGEQGQSRRATTEVGAALTSHLLIRYEDAKVESCERISINPRGEVNKNLKNNQNQFSFEFKKILVFCCSDILPGGVPSSG